MASREDMVAPEDDYRHEPSAGAGELWNESWWFPWYDPEKRLGLVSRIGLLPRRAGGEANAWVMIVRDGRLVYSGNALSEPLPAGDPREGIRVAGLTYRCLEPHRRWHLSYRAAAGEVALEGEWAASSPAYGYAQLPGGGGPGGPGRLEQSGRFRGTVTLGDERIEVDAVAHRDHSWGAERDWSALGNWTYVNGEFSDGFAFNAIQVPLTAGVFYRIGYVCVGGQLRTAADLAAEVEVAPQGTHHLGARIWLVDECGSRYDVDGRCLVNCPVDVGTTVVNDAISEFRCRGVTGYGVIEWGYQKGG